MLEFTDTPYQFYAARPSRLLIGLGRVVNGHWNLPSKRHLITDVAVEGMEHYDSARRVAGKRILFLPNHSTHSDPQIMLEVQRQCGVMSCFMAAYEVFQRNKLMGWLMQRGGCFSVNRDGNDSKSMREAMRLLQEGAYALTLFPEGNVYLMNDRITPFLDGAAFIGMKAQKTLGPESSICVLPVAIKVTHLTDQRAAILDKLERMAGDIGSVLNREAPPADEVKRIGLAALERLLQQRGLIPKEPGDGSVRDHLEHCATLMIGHLESKMGLPTRSEKSLNERVRKIRSTIHRIRTDPNKKADHQVAVTWAGEAMLALRILSYSGDYLDQAPTLDRVGESVEKLLEDVYSETQSPYGERKAIVRLQAPVDLTHHLEAYESSARETVATLTTTIEESVQEGLDAINGENQSLGREPF